MEQGSLPAGRGSGEGLERGRAEGARPGRRLMEVGDGSQEMGRWKSGVTVTGRLGRGGRLLHRPLQGGAGEEVRWVARADQGWVLSGPVALSFPKLSPVSFNGVQSAMRPSLSDREKGAKGMFAGWLWRLHGRKRTEEERRTGGLVMAAGRSSLGRLERRRGIVEDGAAEVGCHGNREIGQRREASSRIVVGWSRRGSPVGGVEKVAAARSWARFWVGADGGDAGASGWRRRNGASGGREESSLHGWRWTPMAEFRLRRAMAAGRRSGGTGVT